MPYLKRRVNTIKVKVIKCKLMPKSHDFRCCHCIAHVISHPVIKLIFSPRASTLTLLSRALLKLPLHYC